MRSWLAAVILGSVGSVGSAGTVLQGGTPASVVPDIERAVLVGDTAALERSREWLRANLPRENAPPTDRYTLAYVDWRLTHLYGAKRKRDKQARLDEARALLERLVDDDPKNAEAHALLGGVYGGLIDLNPLKAITLGRKSSDTLATAVRLAPDNPRVLLLSGMNAVYTPTVFGGGLDVAERHLRRADALFPEPSDSVWPNWGRLDTLAWLGQVLAKKGDRDGARAMYDRALTIAPEYAWVKAVLLPSLNRTPARR